MKLGPFLPSAVDSLAQLLTDGGVAFSIYSSKAKGSGWNPQVANVYFIVDDAVADTARTILNLPLAAPVVSDGTFELSEDNNERQRERPTKDNVLIVIFLVILSLIILLVLFPKLGNGKGIPIPLNHTQEWKPHSAD